MAILPLAEGQKEIIPDSKNKKDEKHIGVAKKDKKGGDK